MNKAELINEVIYEMSGELNKEQVDRLKITMLVKMQNFEVSELQTLPCVITNDNEWLLKRFLIDGVARGVKESTIRQYLRAVNILMEETHKNYQQITGQDITDYLAMRQYRDHISINYKSTLNRYFFAFFQWAYRKRHIAEDIMRDVDRVKTVQKKKERLSDEEIEDIREACGTLKEKALVELMLSTGMRVGEITALNINDLDLAHKRISIYGEKTSKYRIGMLSTKAVKALRAYITVRESSSEALFVAERQPCDRMGKAAIEKMAREIAVRAGVRLRATVHVYRKTFASVMYRKTKNILFVSKLLGHASTAITVQYYLVDDIEDMQHMYNIAQG